MRVFGSSVPSYQCRKFQLWYLLLSRLNLNENCPGSCVKDCIDLSENPMIASCGVEILDLEKKILLRDVELLTELHRLINVLRILRNCVCSCVPLHSFS